MSLADFLLFALCRDLDDVVESRDDDDGDDPDEEEEPDEEELLLSFPFCGIVPLLVAVALLPLSASSSLPLLKSSPSFRATSSSLRSIVECSDCRVLLLSDEEQCTASSADTND